MNRRHTYGNRIIEEAEIARKKAIHRRKRDAPKNKGVDNRPPRVHSHLVTRAKKRMQERERILKIERENKLLLQRMAEIGSRRFDPNAMQMGSGVRLNRRQQPVLDCYLSPMGASNLSRGAAVPKPSLNYRVRKAEAERVQHANIRMLRRIVDTKSIMSVDKLEAEHRMSRYHLARLSTRALGEPGSGLGSGGHPREPSFGARHFYGPLGISRKMLRGEDDEEGGSGRFPGIGDGSVTGTEQGGPEGGGPLAGEGEDDGYGDLGYGEGKEEEKARTPTPPPAPAPAPTPVAPAPAPPAPVLSPLPPDDNQADAPLHGVLVVHVEAASGLKDTDWIGSTDAYAKVSFDGVAHSTATIADSTEPEFHETFEFIVTQDIAAVAAVGGRDATVEVELFDSDTGSDTRLGVVTLVLADLLDRSGDAGRSSVNLSDGWDLEGGQGRLELTLQWKPFAKMTDVLSPKTAGSSQPGSARPGASDVAGTGGPTAGAGAAVTPAPAPAPAPVPLTGSLVVRVVRATGIKDADWSGKSDPYAIVTVDDASETTHTKYDTLEPLWNATYAFPVSKELAASASVAAPHATVDVTLKDNDTGTDGDLGAVTVPIIDIFRAAHAEGHVDVGHADALVEDVYPLGKDFPGRLELHLWWFPFKTPEEAKAAVPPPPAEEAAPAPGDAEGKAADTPAPAPAPAAADAVAEHQEGKDDEVTGSLVVAVGSASKIEDADTMGGGTDGYVTLEIDGMSHKTAVVPDTQSPVWNEVFTFTVSRETSAVAAVGDRTRGVLVKVMDEDTMGDDLVGQVLVPLCDIFGAPNGTADNTVSGRYTFEGKKPGSLAMAFTWIKHGTATSADTEAAKAPTMAALPPAVPAGAAEPAAPAPAPAAAPAVAAEPAPAAHVAKGGTLVAHVASAKNLRDADMFDGSDPYCAITFGEVTVKTATVDNTSDPVWDEDLSLVITASDAAAATAGGGEDISIKVFDEDAAGDDELGSTTLRLTDVFALYGGTGADATHEPFKGDAWYDINSDKGSKVHIEWSWTPEA